MKIPTYNFSYAYLYEIIIRTDMKLKFFISYSRSIKEDVRAVIELLRKTGHEVWWDADIAVIADWWATILDNIEWCNVFIFIVSEKSVESPYCLAELKYATERNRPILPFVIDDHTRYTLPPEVTPMRNQWLKYDGNPSNMLAEIIRSCGVIPWEKFQDTPFPRPLEPNTESGSLTKQFQQANDLAKAGHFEEAKKRLRNVASLDNKKWGQRCEIWIRRLNLYAEIVELAEHEATLEFARESWQDYLGLKDSLNFDPFDIAAKIRHDPAKDNESSHTLLAKPVLPQSQLTQREVDEATEWLRQLGAWEDNEQAQIQERTTLNVTATLFDILPAPFDMIEIPKGSVTVNGKTETIDTFQIAKYPVTNAQFAKFIEAGGYENKDWWTTAGWEARKMEKWIEPRYWREYESNTATQPVVGISWYEAIAFCIWLTHETVYSITLPTEEQWQRAAQGDDKRTYPWGNDWDDFRCCNNINGGRNSTRNTCLVTQYEGKNRSDSYFGVVDMAGNVWEWCRTLYKTGSNDINGKSMRVIRGGSWFDGDADVFRCDFRLNFMPLSRGVNIGFRFVCSP